MVERLDTGNAALADKLQALFNAEHESAFLDCVADNIETIIGALRGVAQASPTRDELLQGLADFFSESIHHVWSNDEIATCLIGMIDTPTPPVQDAGKGEAVAWIAGAPPKPWSSEWFIAQTTFGDRVVLKALPDEWTYDFKTADDTYIKADKIKCWMQFPDSEFVAAPQPASNAYAGRKLSAEEMDTLQSLANCMGFGRTVSALNNALEILQALSLPSTGGGPAA